MVRHGCGYFTVFWSTFVALSGGAVLVFGVYASSPAMRDPGIDTNWHVHYVNALLIATGGLEFFCGVLAPCCLAIWNVVIVSIGLLSASAIQTAICVSLFDRNAASNFVKGGIDSTQQYRLGLFYSRFGVTNRSSGNSPAAILIICGSVAPMLLLFITFIIRQKLHARRRILAANKALSSSPSSPQMSQPMLMPATITASPPTLVSPEPAPVRCGVGCFFHGDQDGSMCVTKFVPGSPAEMCGQIETGDVIMGVNGVNVYRKPLSEVSALLLGPYGSEVDLTFKKRKTEQRYTVKLQRLSAGKNTRGSPQNTVVNNHTMIPQSPPTMLSPGSSYDPTAGQVGVGLVLQPDDMGILRVSMMVPGGAAEKSGQIVIGDRVIEVGGFPVRNETVHSIQSRILGPPGTMVRVYLARDPNPQPFAVDLVRQPSSGSPNRTTGYTNATATLGFLGAGGMQQTGGVGLVINEAFQGALYVTAVLPGGPASLAGVEVGSCLYTIDGVDVSHLPPETVTRMVRGPLGSSVVLGFRKGGSEQLNYVSCLRTLPEPGDYISANEMMPPTQPMFREMGNQGNDDKMYGVGIYFVPDGDGGQMVGRLVEGGPADSCGRIYQGDVLHYVDGHYVYGKSVQQLAKYLLGRRGSTARLGFKRHKTGRFADILVERGASAEERGAKKLAQSPSSLETSFYNSYHPSMAPNVARFHGNNSNTYMSNPPTMLNNNNNNNSMYDHNNSNNNNNDPNMNWSTRRPMTSQLPNMILPNSVGGDMKPPVGIGVQVIPDAADGSLIVSAIQPGGGAWRSEVIEVGDTLVAVDGQNVYGSSPSFVASLLTGPHGSTVHLSVKKRTTGRLMDVSVVRGWWS